ncbi:stage II sporulation protein R [Bacillus sp. FJAT-50079]|nr:stage II sporulation protein R [Bacillus sp. FJAT-50079]
MNKRFYQKNIALLYIIVLTLGTIVSFVIPRQETVAADAIVTIPEEAIRLRILANSDNEKDQAVKRKIRDAVNEEITNWVQSLTSLDDARTVITSHLDEIEQITQRELEAMGLDYSFKVEFGDVQFPTKLYGEFLYPAGTYEAVLITLGEGGGANWWCVLFPPLCFLDFSNGLAVGPGFEEDLEQDAENEEIDQSQSDSYSSMDSEQVVENEEMDDVVNKLGKSEQVAIPHEPEIEGKDEPIAFIAEEEDKVEVKWFISEVFNFMR